MKMFLYYHDWKKEKIRISDESTSKIVTLTTSKRKISQNIVNTTGKVTENLILSVTSDIQRNTFYKIEGRINALI